MFWGDALCQLCGLIGNGTRPSQRIERKTILRKLPSNPLLTGTMSPPSVYWGNRRHSQDVGVILLPFVGSSGAVTGDEEKMQVNDRRFELYGNNSFSLLTPGYAWVGPTICKIVQWSEDDPDRLHKLATVFTGAGVARHNLVNKFPCIYDSRTNVVPALSSFSSLSPINKMEAVVLMSKSLCAADICLFAHRRPGCQAMKGRGTNLGPRSYLSPRP